MGKLVLKAALFIIAISLAIIGFKRLVNPVEGRHLMPVNAKLSAGKLRHIVTGQEVVFVKYLYRYEKKGLDQQPMFPRFTKHVKVAWTDGSGQEQTAVYPENELEQVE